MARSYVDTGSSVTGLDVRSYIGRSNLPGLEVFHSSLQLDVINAAEVYLVPPPPPLAWGTGWLVDDRPYFASPVALPVVNASCSLADTRCVNSGVCTEAVFLSVVEGGLLPAHGDPVSPAGEIVPNAGPL